MDRAKAEELMTDAGYPDGIDLSSRRRATRCTPTSVWPLRRQESLNTLIDFLPWKLFKSHCTIILENKSINNYAHGKRFSPLP